MYGLCLLWHVSFGSKAVGAGHMMNEDTSWSHAVTSLRCNKELLVSGLVEGVPVRGRGLELDDL